MSQNNQQELSMRTIREVLRLGLQCGMGQREISRSCKIAHSTAGKYLQRAQEAQLSYEQIKELDEGQLYSLLKINSKQFHISARPQADWNGIHQELKKPGVTLQLLWEEYKAIHSDGYQLSQFCECYRRWQKTLNVSMRQVHKAGEKMFVDYAGQQIPIRDQRTGKDHPGEIFVAVLGASNYTYAEASWDQGLESWINSHIHAYEYFGGVPKITVPDNLKSGISKACRYEPDINPSYHDMAVHYGTAIIPTRVRHPKDKAKVEVGVQVVERWILARLRNQIFFNLNQVNKAIAELLTNLNGRKFKKLEGSRRSIFETLERPALLSLPESHYEFAQWKKARVNIDYHVELNGHYYSVPYTLGAQTEVHLRTTQKVVEIIYNNRRIASHRRDESKGKHTTTKEHMPKSHQQYLEWSPSRIINWAKSVGEFTAKLFEIILNTRQYPEQGYRSCLGILRLAKDYGNERVEAACHRAFTIGGHSYKSVRSILEKGLDQQPLPETFQTPVIQHENIRGQHYF